MQDMNLNEPSQQPEKTGFGAPSNGGFTPATAMDSQITPSHDVFGQGPSALSSEPLGGGSSYQQPSQPPIPFPQSLPEPLQTGPLDVDAMVLPALKANAGANQPAEYPEGEDPRNNLQVEELTAEDRKTAGPMIDVFGEDAMRKIFSSTWALREEGINEVDDLLRNAGRRSEAAEYFVNAVGVSKLTIQDKMAGVAQRSMGFLATVCRLFPDVSLDGHQRSQF